MVSCKQLFLAAQAAGAEGHHSGRLRRFHSILHLSVL